jgi:hypothetical protein
MLIAGPQIARLVRRPPRWALRKITAGVFGPVVRRRGRIREVELAVVEQRVGLMFTHAQLIAAGVRVSEPETL